MALSSPQRPPSISVYGVDPDVWAQFRAWCVARRASTGEEVQQALEAWMSSPTPNTVRELRGE